MLSEKSKIIYSGDKHFRLRSVEKNDLEFLLTLRNHPETLKYLGDSVELTMDMQEKWFSSLPDKTDRAYYVYEKLGADGTWTQIGMVRTHNIDYNNKNMGVGGDILPAYRNLGYGKIMYDLIFNLSFKHLKLHRVWLSVLEYNYRAFNLYKKVGFREVGRQREAVFKNGIYYNYIYMDILETEYNQLMGAKK